MLNSLARIVSLGICVAWSITAAQAFSLKTHLWIAEQIIEDLRPDCRITLELVGGSDVKEYEVPPDICAAIKSNPAKYRAGHLGPDVFPDPITGQMTTHPGDVVGWSTERWLRHVVNSAQTPEELALSYGFVGHASADIFAHTFVNQYAGDIFLLSDNETQVELRHFALEKYIEGKTPRLPYAIDAGSIAVPERFLSKSLIFDKGVAGQYSRQPATLHLASLYQAREAVHRLSGLSRSITDRIIKTYADYYKLQLKEFAKIATFEREVGSAKRALDVAGKALETQMVLLNAAQKGVDDAENAIENDPELLKVLGLQISDTLSLLADAANAFQGLIDAKSRALNEYNRARGRFEDLTGCDAGNVCKQAAKKCGFLQDFCGWAAPVCTFVEHSNPACGPIKKIADDLLKEFERATDAVARNLAETAELEARKAALTAKELETSARLAAAKLAIAALREALNGQKKLIEIRQAGVEQAKKAVAFAEQKLAEVRKEAEPVLKLVDQIAEIAKEYNTISLAFGNWREGIDRAGDDFISASMKTGFSMINEDGKFLEHYKYWLECSALNFLGVPYQIPRAYCESKDKLAELNAEIEKLKEKLPPILRWMLDPLNELKKEARKVATKELWKAAKACADFVGGKPTGRFIGMLASQEKATPDALRQIYSDGNNRAGKKLLVFGDVLPLVDKDIGLSGNQLDPAVFHALRNGVVLTKLSLLAPSELNRLHTDLAQGANRYAPELYQETGDSHFSLLFYAVRSIDGNHQWQPFGLPYLRSDKNHQPSNPAKRRYGFSVHDNKFDGFRLFQDPIARENVFLRLFSGPVEGSMATIPQAQLPDYPYQACESNPFPRTVDDNGKMILEDRACVDSTIVAGKTAPRAKVTSYYAGTPSDPGGVRANSVSKTVTCEERKFLFGAKKRTILARVSGTFVKSGRYRCTWGVYATRKDRANGWWKIDHRQ